jgi:HEAT repeat protein
VANPPDAVDQLDASVRATKRPDDVREAALEGLAALAPKDLEARLQRYVKKAPLTTTALSLLVEHGTPSALAFVKDIARTDRDPETRVAAVDAFWERGTDLFIELLDDPADDVREAALNALGRQGNSKAASIAEARLNHEDPARAAEAAGVLLDLGGAPAARNDARIRTLAKGNSMLEWKLD